MINKICKTTQDVTWDLFNKIKEASENESLICFEKGTYHFYPDFAQERVSCVSNHENDGFKKISFLIEDMEGLTIDGNGSEFIFHGIINPFSIVNSKNITIKNFSINFPKTMYAHATVLENGEHYSIIKANDGEKFDVIDGRLVAGIEGYEGRVKYTIEIDPERDDIRYQFNDDVFGKWFESMNVYAEKLDDNTFKLFGTDISKYPVIGDTILFGFGYRFAPGIFIENSENIRIENVIIHHCLGMGILGQLSKNITMDNLKIIPSQGRYISAHADGTHFVECCGYILMENSLIEKQMDDPINCHGIYAQISRIIDKKSVLVRLVQKDQLGVRLYQVNDRIEWVNHDTLLKMGESTVKDVEYLSRECCILNLQENIPDGVGENDCVENIMHCPELILRNNIFRKNRARGPLITTRGKVIVENNTFDLNGSAIQIAGDANCWFESGCVRDVVIRKNRFVNCNRVLCWGEGTILINPSISHQEDECYHQNIIIEDNEFYSFENCICNVNSVDGFTFRNNKIVKSKDFPPINTESETFKLLNCKNVCIENNGTDLTDVRY